MVAYGITLVVLVITVMIIFRIHDANDNRTAAQILFPDDKDPDDGAMRKLNPAQLLKLTEDADQTLPIAPPLPSPAKPTVPADAAPATPKHRRSKSKKHRAGTESKTSAIITRYIINQTYPECSERTSSTTCRQPDHKVPILALADR